MSPLSSLTLLLNGLTLTLSLSFLLITLWQDTRKELSQFFAIFLFMVTLWNVGSLLLQAAALIESPVDNRSVDWIENDRAIVVHAQRRGGIDPALRVLRSRCEQVVGTQEAADMVVAGRKLRVPGCSVRSLDAG